MTQNSCGLNKSLSRKSRMQFSKDEDKKIIFAVSYIGTRQWPMIAKFLKGRTAKQCRDRYMNYLKPGLSSFEWTQDEDNHLIELYSKFGPKWGSINKYFKNRNQLSLKNRFQFLQKNMDIINFKENKQKGKYDFQQQNLNCKNEFKIENTDLESEKIEKIDKKTEDISNIEESEETNKTNKNTSLIFNLDSIMDFDEDEILGFF